MFATASAKAVASDLRRTTGEHSKESLTAQHNYLRWGCYLREKKR